MRRCNSDKIREILDWAPSTTRRYRMERTYRWVYDRVRARVDGRRFVGRTAEGGI